MENKHDTFAKELQKMVHHIRKDVQQEYGSDFRFPISRKKLCFNYSQFVLVV